MTDQSEQRMNLAAIKRVDPYARDIIDSSAHVAFYTFNPDETEWEKTDVEGAFFIYSRTAEPLYSIFINNRLNTNSLVEPIAGQLELQSQPPFLLYRNERSRIRGFWFYNKTECDRIGELVDRLIKESCEKTQNGVQNGSTGANNTKNAAAAKSNEPSARATNNHNSSGSLASNNGGGGVAARPAGVDIFTMLSKAQEDFNNAQSTGSPAQHQPVMQPMAGASRTPAGPGTGSTQQQQQQPPPTDVTSQSVMNFFAAAIPATAKEVPFFQRMLSQPMSVDQLEKQHQNRSGTPHQEKQPTPPRQSATKIIPLQSQPISQPQSVMVPESKIENGIGFMRISSPSTELLGTSPLATFINTTNMSGMSRPNPGSAVKAAAPTDVSEIELRQQPLHQLLRMSDAPNNTPGKPALMLPTMFASTSSAAPAASNNDAAVSTPSLLRPIAKKNAVEANTVPTSGGPLNQWIRDQQTGSTVQATPPRIQSSANTSFTKPEPLTQSQLLQAMNYLIKNDPDFVRKLHEAYLKSFTDMVSL